MAFRPELIRGGAVLTGGSARGAKLFTIAGLDVRPALARLRNSLFQILAPRLGGPVLDLFAGIGTMGLEALSRGAEFAMFIDTDPRCVAAIRKNLEKLRLADRAEVLEGDALQAPALVGRQTFEIVFVDPPYALYQDSAKAAALEAAVASLPVKGLIVVEHRTIQQFPERWGNGVRVDERKYGGTTVTLFER